MELELGFFHFKSICYTKKSSMLFFGENDLIFSNFITGDKKSLEKYAKEIFGSLHELAKKNEEELMNFIKTEKHYDFIDSNYNLEKIFWTLREYGLSERFIIKKMFRGENIKPIEYVNSENTLDIIKPFLNDFSLIKIFKMPIKLGDENRIRLLVLWDVNKKTFAPLFVDNQHVLFSSSKIEGDWNKNISSEFYKMMHQLFTKL